jgi:copper chaperone
VPLQNSDYADSIYGEFLAGRSMNRRVPSIIKRNMPVENRWEFTLKIDGMHCGSCIRRVSQALAAVPGVRVNEVRIGAARLTSLHDPQPVNLVIDALAKSGYAAHLES